MTKIALVSPGKNEEFSVNEPLNLGYIASFLEYSGHEVIIADQLAGQEIHKKIKKFNPEFVGITATTPVINEAYKISEWCKQKGFKTVIGGVHASILPEEASKHCDLVVKGEGELAMMEILERDVDSGIIEGNYIKNLDDIPPPARHLIDMEFYMGAADRFPGTYLSFIPPKTKVASVLTSRGCPYSCAFCHNSWKGMPFRFNSPERVIEELRSLKSNYKVGAVFFIEDNFFVSKKRVEKICTLLKEEDLDIIWAANARVNNVNREILNSVKKVGCRQITFGFESGSQRILDVLNKGIKVGQSVKAIKLCKEAGLSVNGTIMIGNPTETVEDIKMTQKFIKENDIDGVGVCFTTPFPGTKLWQMAQAGGLLPGHLDWDDFALNIPKYTVCKDIPLEELKRMYYETIEIANSNKNVQLSRLLYWGVNNPSWAIKKLLRNPKEVINTFKRVSI